jgi:hypothetical protein
MQVAQLPMIDTKDDRINFCSPHNQPPDKSPVSETLSEGFPILRVCTT